MLAAELAVLGVRIRFVLVPRDLEWMHESLATVARRAVGVAILRRNARRS